jgi:hypothetical protein
LGPVQIWQNSLLGCDQNWKTLKTVENLAEKPDLTLGTCLNPAKLYFGACLNLAKLSFGV